MNLSFHEADFGIRAEWNFFGTAHGKNACDGKGGTLKRSAAKKSLQQTMTNQILTPLDFFNHCKENIPSVCCFFTTKEEVKSVTTELAPRFNDAVLTPGTRKLHHFKPVADGFMEVVEFTFANATRKMVKIRNVVGESTKNLEIEIGMYENTTKPL
jgi:hypothetical protein